MGGMSYVLLIFLNTAGVSQPHVVATEPLTLMQCLIAGQTITPQWLEDHHATERFTGRTACLPSAHVQGYLMKFGRGV